MKPKVENGEVIEAFRKQKHWGALMYEVDISIVQDIMKREEAFITNALNQQKKETYKEIRVRVQRLRDNIFYPQSNSEDYRNFATEGARVHLDIVLEFLTKLEGKE